MAGKEAFGRVWMGNFCMRQRLVGNVDVCYGHGHGGLGRVLVLIYF